MLLQLLINPNSIIDTRAFFYCLGKKHIESDVMKVRATMDARAWF